MATAATRTAVHAMTNMTLRMNSQADLNRKRYSLNALYNVFPTMTTSSNDMVAVDTMKVVGESDSANVSDDTVHSNTVGGGQVMAAMLRRMLHFLGSFDFLIEPRPYHLRTSLLLLLYTMGTILEVRTVQSGAFKVMIEALKDLLTDTSIEFDPDTGMKVVAMDGSHIVLVHLHLEASKFESFFCKERTCIGVNMMQLHKLIRSINNNDSLTLFMESGDMNHLGIKIENSQKGQKTMFRLNLLDLDYSRISIDPVEFASVITLPSTDFQKIVRDMNNLAEFVEIKNIQNQLIFQCHGEFCVQETVMTDSDAGGVPGGNHSIQPKTPGSDEIIQGVFSLKYLVLFSKCTNLCNTVQLFLRNDYPLIIVYQVASLGEIKLALAPQSAA